MWLLLIPVCTAALWLVAKRWPSRSLKARISHGLHQAVALLAVLALAGASVPSPAQSKAVWLVVDASDSMAGQNTVSLAQQALSAVEEGRAGVIAFGERAMVETPLSEQATFSGVQTAVEPSASNLEEALQLAMALLPGDCAGGVAVISDGLVEPVNLDKLQGGVAVNALQTQTEKQKDAQVTQVQMPSTAYQGQQLTMTVTVHSTAEGPARMLLLANGSTSAVQEVVLRRGENTFAFQTDAQHSGVVTYEAQVALDGDENSRNDKMGAAIAVTGAPAVLLVEGKGGEGAELRKMLEASGMAVETVSASALPSQAADYMAWHAFALVNVDADSLTDAQSTAMVAAVRELGRGAAVFGGDSSYALGNYRGSVLEGMLPVTIDVKNKLELPSTALVLAIDKSGSMTSGQYGVTRLEVAKEAACRAVEVLTEQDMAGVIAFDDTGKWALPLTKVTDVAAMQEQIGTIRPGGGTAFYSPLAMALDALQGVEAQHKHVIFLTDGQSGDQGYDQLAQEMSQQGITLTGVAVGSGADAQAVLRLSELGGGRAYLVGEFDNVPKIFTKETLLAAGAYVQNRNFTPRIADTSMTNFPGFPQLTGYLATTEKPLATVSLISDREDPILAWWQYGAGRVACWTSDVHGAWSSAFLQWKDATAFFSGIVSHVLPAWNQQGEMSLEDGVLTYTAPQMTENTMVEARVLMPTGEAASIPLEQVSANAYAAAWNHTEPGAYAVQIVADGETVLEGGAVIPYAKEYDLRTTDQGALNALSQATGGKAVTDPKELLSFPQTNMRVHQPLMPGLVLLMLALLLADIAQRRLNWEKTLPQGSHRKPHQRPQPDKPKPKGNDQPGQTAQQLWDNLQNRKRL